MSKVFIKIEKLNGKYNIEASRDWTILFHNYPNSILLEFNILGKTFKIIRSNEKIQSELTKMDIKDVGFDNDFKWIGDMLVVFIKAGFKEA